MSDLGRAIAPPLAPVVTHDIVRDADLLLALMGKEPLPIVAELANTLSLSAYDVGARDIEEAARSLRDHASSGGPVALAGAMRALTEAIVRTERSLVA